MPTTYYEWDPISDNIVAERDENGNVIVEYTTEPGYHGAVINEHRNGQTYYHHNDGQGNLRALTNDQGEVTDTFAYTSNGELTERTGTTPTPFQFGGQHGYYTDPETNELMVRQRILEPQLGRWLSADPLRLADIALIPHRLAFEPLLIERLLEVWPETQFYTYVDNDPVNSIDPSGLVKCKPIDGTPFACDATGAKGIVKPLPDGGNKVGGHVDLIGSFLEGGDCKCRCCKMELWVRGEYAVILPPPAPPEKSRVPIPPHVLPGSGKPLDPKLFQQDSPRLPPTGCKLKKTDFPGIPFNKKLWDGLAAVPGVQIELHYDFELHAIDTCNKDARVGTYDFTWELRGPITAPKIVTDLAPCPAAGPGVPKKK